MFGPGCPHPAGSARPWWISRRLTPQLGDSPTIGFRSGSEVPDP